MLDYAYVTNRLLVGGHLKNEEERLNTLLDSGVTHIVNVQAELDDADLLARHAPFLSYLYLPVEDDLEYKSNEWFEEIIDYTLDALTQPETKVYIHCAAGKSRSVSAVYAILRAWGLSQEHAKELIFKARPDARINYLDDAERAIRELKYTNAY